MKHQQIQLASKRNFIRIMALVAMLAVMVCGMIIAVNADAVESVTFEGSNVTLENGYWVKNYDGNANVTGTVKVNGEAATAVFNSANVNAASAITVTYAGGEIVVPAKIKPAQLTWANDASVSVVYNPVSNVYADVAVTLPALNGVIGNDSVAAEAAEYTVSFSATTVGANVTYTYVDVALNNANYTVAPLKVNADVTPVVIESIAWNGIAPFTYGDDLSGIKAIGTYAGGTVELSIENLAAAVNAGDYTLVATAPNALYVINSGVSNTQNITIAKKAYNVVLNGREFFDNGEILTSNVSNKYQLVVAGANGVQLPQEILAAITYTYNGSQTAPSAPGTYTVKATIPTFANYELNATTLEATMNVVRNYQVIATPNGAIVIVGENGISNTVSATLSIPTEFARKAVRGLKAYQGYALTITGAAAGEKFNIYIPVATDLIADKNCQPLVVENLYVYDGAQGIKSLAKAAYTVSMSEDKSYYIIEGYVPAGEITFMLAPDYNVPFFASAIGIALIVLVALILIVVIPIFVGMKLLQLENSGRNPVISVETVGNVPEVEPVIIPDIIENPDEIIEDGINALAETLAAEVAPEEAEVEVDATEAVAEAMADLNAEVAAIDLGNADEALNAMAEQKASDLAEEVGAEEATNDVSDEVQQAVADAMAENFNESADATDAIALVEDEEVVEEPVVEEVVEEEPVVEEPVAEEVVEEEPVVEEPVVEEPVVEEPAIEEPASEESASEDGEDDEEESFGGFGSMPLDYIDAIVEAERYAEMLEQERRGEVQLVTRYRRSYLSRLAQSQGSIQDYYNAIKNLLLSYKGVKSRTSWNFESFNVGRTPIAKFNAKTRTLYVYIAFSPEELADSKYNFTDMSAKKKYAAVPVLLKVKGERKFKHALEILTKLCEEKLQLPKKKNFQEVDYRMPFKTTEELVNEGIIKMMVAAIPVSAPEAEEPVVEEAPVEETPVEEVVIDAAPTEEVPVEEAVIEAAPVEEAPAEEAVIEEVPAEASEEETPVEEATIE